MGDFWNRFWYSMLKMSQKEMSNIDFFDLLLACIMAVITVQLLGLLYARICNKARNLRKEVLIMLLVMVMLLMWEIAVTGREQMSLRTIRTEIWWFGKNMDDNTANFLNVMFFVPFGIVTTWLQKWEKGWRRILITGCLSFWMSASIEISQYITARGYTELVDLETNVFGGIVGAVLAIALEKLRKKEEKINVGQSL
ncbi:MAG: VanZ family protein [Lachnospiraceae bacterium]|nr:VanZ family protein [Lachnospiraceae bacterium]